MRRVIAATTLALCVAGCTNIAYYAQAVQGHLRLMAATRPIEELVRDETTDPRLRNQLAQANAIRQFASRELALPDNGSYRLYADLGRSFVVWNVFAAPEFSVEPQQWCLLVVGCISYRGYYDKADAERYAEELRQTGADTSIRGVPAYSTLGYYDDPVLNTFLRLGEQEVARIVFHELAHQLVYVKGDSTFNESLATAVEIEGLRRWLAHSVPGQLPVFESQYQRRIQFQQLVDDTRHKLRAIYSSFMTPEQMRQAKADAMAEMRRVHSELKTSWAGYAGYDQWFGQTLNNATLGSVAVYTQWVAAFRCLLEQEDGDLPRFYQRVSILAGMPKADRAGVLNALLSNQACSSIRILEAGRRADAS